jgi:hypothetical protein
MVRVGPQTAMASLLLLPLLVSPPSIAALASYNRANTVASFGCVAKQENIIRHRVGRDRDTDDLRPARISASAASPCAAERKDAKKRAARKLPFSRHNTVAARTGIGPRAARRPSTAAISGGRAHDGTRKSCFACARPRVVVGNHKGWQWLLQNIHCRSVRRTRRREQDVAEAGPVCADRVATASRWSGLRNYKAGRGRKKLGR